MKFKRGKDVTVEISEIVRVKENTSPKGGYLSFYRLHQVRILFYAGEGGGQRHCAAECHIYRR